MNIKRLLIAVTATGALALLPQGAAEASSHREAPFITKMPKVDNTDFYMFRSYEANRSEFVTLIANYIPLQHSYGGPNYFTMDPDALYEIHIDNTGDAQEDLTFQFRFSNLLNDASGGNTGFALPIGPVGNQKTVSIPLITAAQINDANDPFMGLKRNVKETYEVKVIRGNRRTGMAQTVTKTAGPGGTTFVKPIDYMGTKSLGDDAAYRAYANAHVFDVNIPGCTAPAGKSARVFVGQRKEGFAVLLGNIFDLVNAPLGALVDPTLDVPNPIGKTNVTSIAVEVPIACLKGATGDVIGGWSTASVRQARVINPDATYTRPSREGGAWAQVSRLGSPLVNEVVIGIKDKDRFNASEPKNDAQFADYVTHPTLPALIETLFGAANAPAPTLFPRADLVAAFLTGVPGVNSFGAGSATAEMLRLNTALPARATQFRAAGATGGGLGAAGCFKAGPTNMDGKVLDTSLASCDPAGFPNGRRPGDDVVDIALRVSMGYLLAPNVAGAGNAPLGDAVQQHDGQFQTAFPYLNAPNAGAAFPPLPY
jgi:Domain of unknown function (DUF4331)